MNTYERMKNYYMPPRSLMARLAHITNKRKRLAFGIGFMRWALNEIEISAIGAKYIQHYMHIKSYMFHDFYDVKIQGVPLKGIDVLERMGSIEKMPDFIITKAIIEETFLACLVDSGAAEVMLEPGDRFTEYEFSRGLSEARRWLWSSNGVELVTKRLTWGSLFAPTAEAGEVLFRIKYQGREILTDPFVLWRNNELDISAQTTKTCIGCSEERPCVVKNAMGNNWCRHCSSGINGDDHEDCKHIECGFMDCPDYMETYDNELLDLQEPDEDSYIWEEPEFVR